MRAGLRAVPVTARHSSESPRGTLRNKIYYLQVLKGMPHPRGHTVRVWRFVGQRRGGEREGERRREQGLGALPLWGRAGRPGFPGLTLYRTIYNTKARGGAGGKSEGLTGRVLAAQGLRGRGRSAWAPLCSLVAQLLAASLSRRHARLRWRALAWVLQPAGT